MVQSLRIAFCYLILLLFVSRAWAQDCSVPNVPGQFKAKLAWQSTQDAVSAVGTPMVANLNPQTDSMPEIIVLEGSTTNWDRMQIFRGDGSNAANPMILTIPGGFDFYPSPTPTIGDVNGDGIPELLIACADRRIRVFTNYTENPAAPMTLWITSAQLLDFPEQRPLLADFDQDGITEVYAGSDIYRFDFSNPAAATLIKIINGPANQGQSEFGYYSEGGCNPTAVDILSVADCNGDPDANGLELVAGPVIYSIDLDLGDGDGYQIKVQRDLNTMVPPAIGYDDGYTAVADIDLDGILDIAVTSLRQTNQFGLYVWNKNGLIRWFPYPNNPFSSGSLACIANVYDDTKRGYAVDFPEILICSSMNFTCYNLHAAQTTPGTPYWWNLPTTDGSGWTGSTVYDFNGDGISEIVYRDESNLRILYGGPTPFPPGVDAQRNWFTVPCISGTADEYPVVADLNNDGETEIAVTGRITPPPAGNFNLRYRGRLRVFKSDSSPWVPCRNVWNQYNYFIVNINDDLQVPQVQQMHHLELPAAGSGVRPFNSYLAQRPLLDENFQSFIPLPDASASVANIVCLGDSIRVQVSICNIGKKTLPAGTPLAFYTANPTTTTAALLGALQWTNLPILKDSCVNFLCTIPKLAGTIFGVVNDDASIPAPFQLDLDFPSTDEIECYYLNNIFQFDIPDIPPPISLGPDLGACQDTVVLLDAGMDHVSYLWQDGSTNATFQVQQAGLYWVETTDFCANKALDSVLVEAYGNPLIQLDTLNGDCFGNPASVTATVQSTHLPLSYLWSTSDVSQGLSGIPDGLYTVTVTDAKGCSSTQSSWVEAGGGLDALAAVDAPILCFGQTGALSLSIVAGNPPFVVQWSDGSSWTQLLNASAGNYVVTVTDADHCTDTVQIALAQPQALISNGLQMLPSCPGLATGSASFLGAAQGTPPYNLLWSNNETTATLDNLPAGIYQLSLTDANGCSVLESIQVPDFAQPVTTAQLSDISCFGANDGSVLVNVLSGAPGFDFLWSNSGTTNQISGLTPGDYSLTLTYASGACSQTQSFQLEEPLPMLLSASSTPAICNGGLGGNLDLSVQNGVLPLTYLWSTNAITEDLQNVGAGMYQVSVTDAGGCTQTLAQTVGGLPDITLNFNAVAPKCAGSSDGVIQLMAGGGTSPFQYFWSDGSTEATLNAVTAGTYTATVTDAAACTQVISMQLTAPTTLLSAGVNATAACPGIANGSLSFLGASQGTPPYSLQWSTGETTPNANNLSAGIYQLTLSDANGCTVLETAEVPAFLAPTVQENSADISCFGFNDGSVAVAVSGGSAGFAYAWSNSETSSAITQLAPGSYTLTLTYANGACTQVFDYQIVEPPLLRIEDALVTPVKCFGESSGAVELSAFGGVAPYGYQWSDNQTTEDIHNLSVGNYALILTDANGCTVQAQFSVLQPVPFQLAVLTTADTCQTGNGSLTLFATGGVGALQYAWSIPGANPVQTNLPAGMYQVTLTDANACTEQFALEVPLYGEIPSIAAFSGILTCAQTSVNVGVSSNQTNLNYTWISPNGTLANQATHTVQTAGTYQVSITNSFGCQSATQLLVQEDVVAPIAEAGPPILDLPCDETLGLLNAVGSSQGAIYENRWLGYPDGMAPVDTQSIVLPIVESGLYIHTVLNLQNGCTAQDSIWVNWDAPIVAAIAVDSIRCLGDGNGKIALQNISGGAAPLYYSINNQPFTSQTVFSNLEPGAYLLRIRDDFGCHWENTIILTEPDLLSVELTANDTSIVLGQAVQLNAQASPVNANLALIEWSPDGLPYQEQSLQQRLKPETHTEFVVRITDRNGCVAEDRLWVSVYNHHIYVPNIILPGSEVNSWFTVFAGDGVLEVKSLRVFDRWGEQVFERLNFLPNAPTLGWDGAYRGEPMNPGVFVWYAEVLLQDGQVVFLKGDVTVAR